MSDQAATAYQNQASTNDVANVAEPFRSRSRHTDTVTAKITKAISDLESAERQCQAARKTLEEVRNSI